MSLQLIITDAGLSAIAQAGTLGPVVISKIAIGSGTWASNPPTSTTALITEIKKITPQGSSTPAPGLIHITAEDSSEDAYSVKEIGLFDANNVLFAIAGGSTTFLTKYTVSTALLSVDISLANVPLGTVTIGNANFTNPPATETTMGVAEIATTAEVVAGTDNSRIVTPAKLAASGYATKVYVDALTRTSTYHQSASEVMGNGAWGGKTIWQDDQVCGAKQVEFSINGHITFGAVNGDNSGGMYWKFEVMAKADGDTTEWIVASSYAYSGGKPFVYRDYFPSRFLTPSNLDLTNKKLSIKVTCWGQWGGDYFIIYGGASPSVASSYTSGSVSIRKVVIDGTPLVTGYLAGSQPTSTSSATINFPAPGGFQALNIFAGQQFG
jgi:hypothetical protein